MGKVYPVLRLWSESSDNEIYALLETRNQNALRAQTISGFGDLELAHASTSLDSDSLSLQSL
jgi:hypothetical protein